MLIKKLGTYQKESEKKNSQRACGCGKRYVIKLKYFIDQNGSDQNTSNLPCN